MRKLFSGEAMKYGIAVALALSILGCEPSQSQEKARSRPRPNDLEISLGPAAFSPDGKLLVGQYSNESNGGDEHEQKLVHWLTVWDVKTGKELWHDGERPVFVYGFVPRNNDLLIKKHDEFILRDGYTGRIKHKFTDESVPLVEALVVSSDSSFFLATLYDGRVSYWSLESKKWVRDFAGRKIASRSIHLSRDGKLALVWYPSRGRSQNFAGNIVLWDVASGKELRRFGERESIGFDISPNGALVAYSTPLQGTWTDKETTICDTTTGKAIWILPDKRIASAKFLADGKTLLTESDERLDRTFAHWDIEAKKLLDSWKVKDTPHVTAWAVSPDNNLLFTATGKSHPPGDRPLRFTVWSIPSKAAVRQMEVGPLP
jgi:WD40 repeat protein